MDVTIQQLLMRFAGTLNRRRAYAATHPIVIAAEEQLLQSAVDALRNRSTLSIGVARHELLIDGLPWESRNSTARELAGRLHRRGVGSITLETGLSLAELRAALAWLNTEPGGAADTPPTQSGLHITRTAYDLLVLDDAIRDAQSAIASLWRVLAEVSGHHGERGVDGEIENTGSQFRDEYAGLPMFTDDALSGAEGFDTDAILAALRVALGDDAIARRTAVALMELTNHGVTTTDEGRALIGEQLLSLLERLGSEALGPIVKSLIDASKKQKFVTQVIDVLPISDAVTWLDAAAAANDQQISHQLVRVMSKLSTLADERGDVATEASFRDAARDLVSGWSLADPNPSEHVELLDRIAGFERVTTGKELKRGGPSSTTIESTRLVQMSLEMETIGADTVLAIDALLATGSGRSLMQWINSAGDTGTATAMRQMITSEKSVRRLLLTEPVDRLEARGLLEVLDITSTDILIDILGEASSKGTRLLVRQRLAEFGDAITPRLLARLTDGPWYLIRNVLSLLHDTETQHTPSGTASPAITQLLEHEQVQVRLEALRVLVGMNDTQRETALSRALADDSERVVVLALQELTDATGDRAALSEAIVSQIIALVDAGRHSEPVRARAVRTLASTRSDAVRDWLTDLVARKSMVLRRLKLADPTPVAASALHVLTRVYSDDPAAAPVLEVASKVSQDVRWQVRDSGNSSERAP